MPAVCSIICSNADRQREDKQRRELMDHGAAHGGAVTASVEPLTSENQDTTKEVGPGLLTLTFPSWPRLNWCQPHGGLRCGDRSVEYRDTLADKDKNPQGR